MAVQTRESYQLYKRYVKNIALIYNSRKDIRAYIELMLSISVIVIFGIFAIRPTLVTITELQKEITERETVLKALTQKVKDLDTAQQLVNQNRRTLSLVDTAVPDGPLPVLYSRQIEGLSRRDGVELFGLGAERVVITGANTQPQPTAAPTEDLAADRYPTQSDSLNFSMNLRGNYINLKTFVSDVERLRRPILIDTLRLTIDEGSETSDLILSIAGRVPFIKTQ